MSFIEFEFEGKTLKIDKMIAESLNSIAYNLQKDMDFLIVISGSRKVRIGKSVLTQTCAAYLSTVMAKLKIHPKAFKLENTFFESQKMIDYALRTEGHQIFIYDEARESLQASKRNVDQQNILDFLNEAGQKNNCYFLVISDFYILKEEVAVGRAELLINCYKEYEQRQVDLFGDGNKIKVMDMQLGFFKLYNDQAKNLMFDIYRTTHRKDYNYVKPTFPPGRFVNQYACDEAAYRKMKQDALARFSSKHEKIDKRDIKLIEQNKKLLDIAKRFMKHQEIADELNVSRVNITTKYKNMAPTSIFDNKPPTEYSS